MSTSETFSRNRRNVRVKFIFMNKKRLLTTYNKRNLAKTFQEDFVLLRGTRKTKNFKSMLISHYEVLRKLEEWIYKLKDKESGQIMHRNCNKKIQKTACKHKCFIIILYLCYKYYKLNNIPENDTIFRDSGANKANERVEFIPDNDIVSNSNNQTKVNDANECSCESVESRPTLEVSKEKRSKRQNELPFRFGFPLNSGTKYEQQACLTWF